MEEIGKILPSLFKSQLSRLEPPVAEVLAPFWTHVAGKALAEQCRPSAFRAGTLTLVTDNADWAAPIKQMAEEIRAQANKFLGRPLVKHIKVLRISNDGVPCRQPANPRASACIRKARTGSKAAFLRQIPARQIEQEG